MLANPHGATKYGYRPAAEATKVAALALDPLCGGWGTDLATAALHFSLGDPRIHTSVVGISKSERLDSLAKSLAVNFPDEFWSAAEPCCPTPPTGSSHLPEGDSPRDSRNRGAYNPSITTHRLRTSSR